MEESLTQQKYEPLYNKIALIDADIIAHRSASIAEPVLYLVAGVEFDNHKDAAAAAKDKKEIIWSRKEDRGLEFAIMVAEQTLQTIVDNAKPKESVLYLSGRNNFRYDVAKTQPYKESRSYIGKPKYLRKIKEHLQHAFGATVTDGIEADDAIGIESTRLGKQSFVCTVDKDMDQLPGWHFNWVADRVYRISRKEADFNLYTQVLTGDSTDDVPGIHGIGPVKARRILEGANDSPDLLRRVWDIYRTTDSRSGTERERWDYFCEQLRLVYILRHSDDLAPVSLEFDEVFRKTSEGLPACNDEDQDVTTTAPAQRLALPNIWTGTESDTSMNP